MKRNRSLSVDTFGLKKPIIPKISINSEALDLGYSSKLPILLNNVFEFVLQKPETMVKEEEDHFDFSAHVMLQQRLGCIIQEGITEGQRFALSSDLWRCASASSHCDVLITLKPHPNRQIMKELVLWLHDIIKKSEPSFDIKIKHHNLTKSYGLYITANYSSLLKGAELCHLKKPIKPSYGGGMRDFTIDEAKCFQGLEIRTNFLSGMERSMIVRQMLLMIKAPSPGGLMFRPISSELQHHVTVPDGATLLVSLKSQGVMENILPLHQPDILADLQKRWVFALLDEQPLEDIKEYFGTEIAMYFAWLGHLTTALWAPAIIGVLIFFIGGLSFVHSDNPDENTLFGDICFVIFALTNCIWSTAYLEMWKRQQAELAFRWGTYELQTDQFLEDPRPAYKGECLKPNPVSGRLEPFYPPWKHLLVRYGVTFPITLVIISFMFFTMFCLLQLQDMADVVFKHSYYFKWIIYLPMIVYALIIVSGDFLYRKLAIFLNDLENYRTDDEYENYLIQKIVMFQCVSAFGSLFYIAFYLNDMRRLQETLATLLITRQLTQNIIEIAVPFIMEKVKVARLTYQMTRSMSDHSLQRHVDAARKRRDTFKTTPSTDIDEPFLSQDTEDTCELESFQEDGVRLRKPNGTTLSVNTSVNRLSSNSEGFELTEAELQSLMTPYNRPLDDYLEMFIQFGYVLLFSPAFPLAAVCALINNLLEIRVDAFKLCNAVQRPFGRRVKSIGAWQKAMEMMGVAGVIVNCALIGQSGLIQRMWPDMDYTTQILFIVALEHFVLLVKAWIDTAIPDIPMWIRIETAKVEHWRREAYKRESRLTGSEDSAKQGPVMNESSSANNFQSPKNKSGTSKLIDQLRFRRVRENRSCTPSGRGPSFY